MWPIAWWLIAEHVIMFIPSLGEHHPIFQESSFLQSQQSATSVIVDRFGWILQLPIVIYSPYYHPPNFGLSHSSAAYEALSLIGS